MQGFGETKLLKIWAYGPVWKPGESMCYDSEIMPHSSETYGSKGGRFQSVQGSHGHWQAIWTDLSSILVSVIY